MIWYIGIALTFFGAGILGFFLAAIGVTMWAVRRDTRIGYRRKGTITFPMWPVILATLSIIAGAVLLYLGR